MRCKPSTILNHSFSSSRQNHAASLENSESSSHSSMAKETKWVSMEPNKGNQMKSLVSVQKCFENSIESSCNRALGTILRNESSSSVSRPMYLRPSALDHLRDSNSSPRKLSLIGQKRSFPHELESHTNNCSSQDSLCEDEAFSPSSSFHSDELSLYGSPINGQRKKLYAPRNPFSTIQISETPQTSPEISMEKNETDFDCLPLEVLTRVVCFLRHKDLRSTGIVCKRFREAVNIATALHFNFTTPEHNRHGLRARRYSRLNSLLGDGQHEERCALNDEQCESPCSSSSDTESFYLNPPNAPKATRKHSISKVSSMDIQRLVAPLFTDSPENNNSHGLSEKLRSQRHSPSAFRSLFGRDSSNQTVVDQGPSNQVLSSRDELKNERCQI